MDNPFAARPNAPESPSPDAPPEPLTKEVATKVAPTKDDPPVPIPKVQPAVQAQARGTAVRVDVNVKPVKPVEAAKEKPVVTNAKIAVEEKPHHAVSAGAPVHPIFQSAVDSSMDSLADEVDAPQVGKKIEASSRGVPLEDVGTGLSEPGVVSEESPRSDVQKKGASEKPSPEEPRRVVMDSHQSVLPPLGMDEVSCRTCRFFEHSAENRSVAVKGECRCKAPTPGKDKVASWPTVKWGSWCGEWDLGVSDEEMVKMARAVADRMTNGAPGGFLAQDKEGQR